MARRALFVGLLALIMHSAAGIRCYQCEQTAGPCNDFCEGYSCVTSFKASDVSSFRQTTYCMSSGAYNGCMGDMATQIFYCYCTTDLCNTPLNETINKVNGVSMTTPTYYTTTTTYFNGRKRRNAKALEALKGFLHRSVDAARIPYL